MIISLRTFQTQRLACLQGFCVVLLLVCCVRRTVFQCSSHQFIPKTVVYAHPFILCHINHLIALYMSSFNSSSISYVPSIIAVIILSNKSLLILPAATW